MSDLCLRCFLHACCWVPVLLFAAPRAAAERADLAQCRAVSDKEQRLQCYDALAEREASAATPSVPGDAHAVTSPADSGQTSSNPEFRWSIVESDTHRLRPHKPNYVMLRQSSSPNQQPFRASTEFVPAGPTPAPVHLDHNEMKFQVSVKAAIAQALPLLGGDLWFAYTQQSNWQIWNKTISRPFRETDYEPEVILAYTLDTKLTDMWTLRHITWGLNHQSNGRGDPLSRSWNRVYAQFELEYGKNLEVLVRPWWRIPETRSRDDNPDIQHYLGHGDLLVNYKAAAWNASLLLRNNLQTHHNRGAVQLDVAFPCAQLGDFVLKMQLFSGYGESLIDYNHRQTTIGLGVEATGWTDRTFARGPKPRGCSR